MIESPPPIDGATQLVGIIGWPVAHSFSPLIHNAAFAALGLNWCYVPLPVSDGHLAAALRGLVALGFRGANVTVPHKSAVLPLLDSIDDAARTIGAVNTIRVDPVSGMLHGLNTDVMGFLGDLIAHGVPLNTDTHALMLGAGGAERACAAALLGSGAVVTLVNRSIVRAADLLHDFASFTALGKLSAISWEALPEVSATGITLIVNATPIGMWPTVEASPWPSGISFPAGATLYDTIYRPARTRLMQDAERAGLSVIGGAGMLIRQGAAAFEIWTRQPAPIDVMRQAWPIRE